MFVIKIDRTAGNGGDINVSNNFKTCATTKWIKKTF